MIRIIVDADSMPVRVREIVAKAGRRDSVRAVFVANRSVPLPAGAHEMRVAPDADETIVGLAKPGDLVVTRDIPLAERLVERGVVVLNDRGDVYTAENIGERRSLRDAAERIRAAGLERMGTRTHGVKEIAGFANALDRELARRYLEKRSGNG